MLLDMRTYRCKPGMIKAHLKLYSEIGKPAQSRNLGTPLYYLLQLKLAIQMNTLIFGFTKTLTIEKKKEEQCGMILTG